MSRKLDIQVAQRLGYQVIETDDCNGTDNYWLSKDGQHVWIENYFEQSLPHYSTRIESAWKVVEFCLKTDNHRFFDELIKRPPLYGMRSELAAKTICDALISVNLTTLKI